MTASQKDADRDSCPCVYRNGTCRTNYVPRLTCRKRRTRAFSDIPAYILAIRLFFISVIALVGGEFLVEKVFTFQTPLSVLIDLVGGLYFIYLLLKESRSWS